MTKRKVPTKEDFARARAADRYEQRGLSDTGEFIKKKYKKDDVVQVFILYSPNSDSFGAYIFYRHEAQISACQESGLSAQIRSDILEELERVGRGNKNDITLHTTFDSDENVQKNYGGDYFDRLR